MSVIDDKIDNIINSTNKSIDKEPEIIIVTDKENSQKDETQQMSQEQANALIEAVADPEKALKLKVGMKIGEKVESGSGKERLDKTAEKVIDAGLKTIETTAETKQQIATKDADAVYFDAHFEELKTAGIKSQTYRTRMKQVVDTNHIWWNVWFFIFLWWVVGINTLCIATKDVGKFFKFIIWFLTTPLLIILIPLAFITGIIGALLYLFVLTFVLLFSKIKSGIKLIIKKHNDTKNKTENLLNDDNAENSVSHIDSCETGIKQTKIKKGGK